MKKILAKIAAVAALTLAIAGSAFAAEYTKGEVTKVDAKQKKITIKHEPLANLAMPAMTMVFVVADDAMLEKVKDQFEYPVFWGCDLQSEHERYITEKLVGGPTFLINYPKEIKAFYMRLNDDGKTVAASDLLVPGIGELIGGSQREERIDVLKARMAECGLDEKDY